MINLIPLCKLLSTHWKRRSDRDGITVRHIFSGDLDDGDMTNGPQDSRIFTNLFRLRPSQDAADFGFEVFVVIKRPRQYNKTTTKPESVDSF